MDEGIERCVEGGSSTIIDVYDKKGEGGMDKLERNNVLVGHKVPSEMYVPFRKNRFMHESDGTRGDIISRRRNEKGGPLGMVHSTKDVRATFSTMKLGLPNATPPRLLTKKNAGGQNVKKRMQTRVFSRCIQLEEGEVCSHWDAAGSGVG
ncbi:uncharacterized protein LAESUDRAFT_722958 [Laetiporus sulphureus 93-53]|uniref:Uncharacterized protein n=1 Tax=Laetiporus sulphureus 93-53 TaxID=1314785 RepID=A0A165FNE7_9APHY|nr:uncharacterized protein LAESUDRAFT_722958 [Laetiporus sulphureus 93-53]KZT09229.1 hypothetical protein LAESUDRAFT_722958 [Laetiporus sulphureus 93-53]